MVLSRGRGLGSRFFIEKMIRVPPPQARMNRATKNEAFRRGEATAGSVCQTISLSPNADITVDITTPKTCHFIPGISTFNCLCDFLTNHLSIESRCYLERPGMQLIGMEIC